MLLTLGPRTVVPMRLHLEAFSVRDQVGAIVLRVLNRYRAPNRPLIQEASKCRELFGRDAWEGVAGAIVAALNKAGLRPDRTTLYNRIVAGAYKKVSDLIDGATKLCRAEA